MKNVPSSRQPRLWSRPQRSAAADVRSDKTGGGNEKSLGAQQRQQSAVDTLTIYQQYLL